MPRSLRRILIASSLIALVIFVALIVKLFDRDVVTFTDEEQTHAPELTNEDPMLGSPNPTVLVVFFSNFACESCADMSETLREIVTEYPNDVLLVWKDFPNESLHPESYRASLAARCAQDQDAFWTYSDYLYNYQRELGDELYATIATEMNLRERKFTRCLEKEKRADVVEASRAEALRLELSTAPTLFINGVRYSGKMTAAELRTLIRTKIEQ